MSYSQDSPKFFCKPRHLEAISGDKYQVLDLGLLSLMWMVTRHIGIAVHVSFEGLFRARCGSSRGVGPENPKVGPEAVVKGM